MHNRHQRLSVGLSGEVRFSTTPSGVYLPNIANDNLLPFWPAALRLDQAGAYCGLSVDTFKEVCPVRPVAFTASTRGHRWLRVSLDNWLASLDPNVQNAPVVARRKIGDLVSGQG